MSQADDIVLGGARRMKGVVSAPALDLEASMDCGQIFGWHKHGATYTGIIGEAAVILEPSDGQVHFVSDRRISPARIASYLGLDEDLAMIRRLIARDGFMLRVLGSVGDLRILRQDAWPCLCSYILSANNRVERIDSLVKEIAARYGTAHEVGGKTVFRLPGPEVLAGCPESGMRACGVGFRAPYLVGAARLICAGEVDLEAVRGLDEPRGREVLKRLPGVGDKIADCVQLFAFSKYTAFPVDVWIQRAIERVYFHSCHVSPEEIRQFGQAYFGRYAGYAQEYIYRYAREFGLDS
jgi:N-glycosylase/DNA lyase